ncbi:MAG: type II CAAX prenyl endopeptidase Rce1 family protein [Terracidiphilus sp.]
MEFVTPLNVAAAAIALAPCLGVAFFGPAIRTRVRALPIWARIAAPALLSIPYALVAWGAGKFNWGWFALYAALPVAIAALLRQAAPAGRITGQDAKQVTGQDAKTGAEHGTGAQAEPGERGNWREFLVLAVLGLAVDLRWFESAWPAHLAIFNKVLLLDAGIYGFLLLRGLSGTGFDLRLRRRDVTTGLRETAYYTPIALAVGLSLGFLHLHAAWPGLMPIAGAWVFTFFFIAVPEELFFRGWLQNLLERRLGRNAALFLTAALFGLAHFNKRTTFFNWRYVLLAAIAGVFYGRAWRRDRRVGASAVTHATVDAIWSLWLR